MNEYISQALDMVSGWDISDEDFVQLVMDQARLMAGINPDELGETILY